MGHSSLNSELTVQSHITHCPYVRVSLSKTLKLKLLPMDGLSTLHGSCHHWCVCVCREGPPGAGIIVSTSSWSGCVQRLSTRTHQSKRSFLFSFAIWSSKHVTAQLGQQQTPAAKTSHLYYQSKVIWCVLTYFGESEAVLWAAFDTDGATTITYTMWKCDPRNII